MKTKTLLAAALGIVMTTAAWAEDMTRQITVTGEGRVEAVPDMATISLGVTSQAEEAEAAMTETSGKVGAILSRLEELGLEKRDVQTRRIALSPLWSDRRQNDADQPAEITGYVASNTVTVRVRDLGALGDILGAVVEDGANEFNGLSFGLQEPDAAQDDARRKAVEDARARAELLAGAAGVQLGPVIRINDQSGARPMPRMMAAMADSRESAVPVAEGEIELNASVAMVFAIEDAGNDDALSDDATADDGAGNGSGDESAE
ncbi:SIMPL domain-containing protein [Pontibaca methylaminivorans]|uniref:SIMPL domain-containing protein n=1 Tax=Pontibaca methylaminivorans TaxID=515897 RepID=UPI002FDA304B